MKYAQIFLLKNRVLITREAERGSGKGRLFCPFWLGMWQGGQCLKCGEGKCKVQRMILPFLFHTTHIQYRTEWYMNRQKTAQDEHKTLKSCMRFNQIFWWIYTIHYTGLLLLLKWCDISKDIRGLICFIRSSISQLRSPCFGLRLSPAYWVKAERDCFCLLCANAEWGSAGIGPAQNDHNSEYMGDFGIPSFLAPIGLAWWHKGIKTYLKYM
jgi:hypothetical protein